nr:hypothetical protein [Endozoicomonas ascidiicola]
MGGWNSRPGCYPFAGRNHKRASANGCASNSVPCPTGFLVVPMVNIYLAIVVVVGGRAGAFPEGGFIFQ